MAASPLAERDVYALEVLRLLSGRFVAYQWLPPRNTEMVTKHPPSAQPVPDNRHAAKKKAGCQSTPTRLISFSLFGQDPKYRQGMLHNILAIDRFYSGWDVVIFCDRLNHDALRLESLGSRVEIVLQQDVSRGLEGAFWRFLAALRPGLGALLFRDSDSLFTTREVQAVGEWLASPYDTHIIRDHPYHRSPVMAGLLGVKGRALQTLAELVQKRLHAYRHTEYGDDQVFLSEDFYPRVRSNALVHTGFIRYYPERTQPMPPDQPGEIFVGAYAFLTPEEQTRYLAVRNTEAPRTLPPPHWRMNAFLRTLSKRCRPLARIRHGSKWLF